MQGFALYLSHSVRSIRNRKCQIFIYFAVLVFALDNFLETCMFVSMYVSTENNSVFKTITNLKLKQPSRDNIMFSVPITCSVTEYFCPIRHSATSTTHTDSIQDNSNFLHLQRVLLVFLQEHFNNFWQAFKASSSVFYMGVIHVLSSFHLHLFTLDIGSTFSRALHHILWDIGD